MTGGEQAWRQPSHRASHALPHLWRRAQLAHRHDVKRLVEQLGDRLCRERLADPGRAVQQEDGPLWQRQQGMKGSRMRGEHTHEATETHLPFRR